VTPRARTDLPHLTRSLSACRISQILCLLVSCQNAGLRDPEIGNSLEAGIVRLPLSAPAPKGGPDICWVAHTTPAVIETVTEHEEVAPASNSGIDAPASYQTRTRQKIVRDRENLWFRTPCPAAMTAEFVASLQRALKVRGLLRGAETGRMDAGTARAIRRFQAARGLDSAILSLEAARELGLVAYSPD
jgi:hypothetical protein